MHQHPYIYGSLFGMALGDGFGYPTEFLSIDEIIAKWPPSGPVEPAGNPILVTDDTQMALAVGQALIDSEPEHFTPASLKKHLVRHYIQWLNDPKNNRAPGMTCLRSCERLESGAHWTRATELNSKGCGANMRVVPVGLMVKKGWSRSTIGAVAQFQSALTHAHPTALAAAEITAIAVTMLLDGVNSQHLVEALLDHCEAQKTVYHESYLEDIWDRPPFRTPQEFIRLGWEQVTEVLQKVKRGAEERETQVDPCLITGEGWIAEEAFATALLCFLWFPQEPTEALRRAVITSGDSDSIACLTGAFCGAALGIDAFPRDWVARLEYQKELAAVAAFYTA